MPPIFPPGIFIIWKVVVIFVVVVVAAAAAAVVVFISRLFIHQKQRPGCIMNDTNIKPTLSSWNQFQKWNHFPLCIIVVFKKLMGLQLIKIFRALPGPRRSNTVCTRSWKQFQK
jgi:hypothetical protein